MEAKDINGRTALHGAALNGHADALGLLLSKDIGAELEAKDNDGQTAPHYAASNGHADALPCKMNLSIQISRVGTERLRLHQHNYIGQRLG